MRIPPEKIEEEFRAALPTGEESDDAETIAARFASSRERLARMMDVEGYLRDLDGDAQSATLRELYDIFTQLKEVLARVSGSEDTDE